MGSIAAPGSAWYTSKFFGSICMAAAMYVTAKPEKKKVVAGLLIPATLTTVLVGITESLDFTFLFVIPALFFLLVDILFREYLIYTEKQLI